MALLTSILLAPTGRSATACHCVHSIQNLFETFGALLCQFEEVTYGSGSQAPGFPRSSFFSCCWRLEASALSWSTASGHLWFRYRSFACIICLKCRHPKFESHHPTRRQFFPKGAAEVGSSVPCPGDPQIASRCKVSSDPLAKPPPISGEGGRENQTGGDGLS